MDLMWIWAIIGVILIAIEIIAIGSMYVFWFGLAALFMSMLTAIAPSITLSVQIIIYAIASMVSLLIWRKFQKNGDVDSVVGQSRGEEIGRVGTVLTQTGPAVSGLIGFTQGLMGSREWVSVSDCVIEAGEKAKVVAVEGNTLRVEKVS